MTVKGVDVSSYQSTTFATTGLAFAFVKATEGLSYTNPRMALQAAHARSQGLVVGFYHFLRPGSVKEQAARFVEEAASLAGDPLWADWEDPGVSNAAKDQFLAEVKRLRGSDHRVGLYSNRDYWLNHDKTGQAGDALWIADYVTAGKPRIQAKWLFHQYTDEPLDTNRGAFADKAALRAWAEKDTTPPPAFEPFPGPAWFKSSPRSPIVTAMGRRLLEVGCGAYTSGPGPQWTPVDRESVRRWQHKLGDNGALADGWFGPLQWAALQVPKV